MICAWVNEPDWGIAPERTWALILDLFAKISVKFVNGPPEFVLPAPWQLLFTEHTLVKMDVTSTENLGVIPMHEKVIPPPPPLVGVVSLVLLQLDAIHPIVITEIVNKIIFFINTYLGSKVIH